MRLLGYLAVVVAWGVIIGVLIQEHRKFKRDRESRAAWKAGLGLKRVR